MKISRVRISKFRGINFASIHLPDHGVFIGDNNTGKSTLLEALDLLLGPDRLSRRYPINEHDFYCGKYIKLEGEEHNPEIKLEATVTDLDEEQARRFREHIEFWDTKTLKIISKPPIDAIASGEVNQAIRVTFIGKYDEEEDDFEGTTYFTRSLLDDAPVEFRKSDKRMCGFLYLRALRTGSRALSLEHGSLLDIILKIKEIRPKMWESIILPLKEQQVASKPEIGVSDILSGVQESLKRYVPDEWGTAPHLKVSNLTRESLRKVITAFITDPSTGASIPFYRQGTGTINMLVLSLLTMIAEGKEGKVIFAMEEPETAIPPYSQKRIVTEVRKLSAQAIFTSHSPYVIEEFSLDETILLDKKKSGRMRRKTINLPSGLKLKRYRQDFRQRFCECLLSRRVLIAEGVTEETTVVTTARRLSVLNPDKYTSLEALGITVLDAATDSQVGNLSKMFKSLGKTTFAICDKQTPAVQSEIESHVVELYMHQESNIEALIVSQSALPAKARYLTSLVANGHWKDHFVQKFPMPLQETDKALKYHFSKTKGNWGISDFIEQCGEDEVPVFLKEMCTSLRNHVEPTAPMAVPVPVPVPMPAPVKAVDGGEPDEQN